MNEQKNERSGDRLKDPVVIIAIAILSGVFVLIGAAIFGWDHGVLLSMGDSNFARGLITYLFAVVTIGTAVVLVVAILTSDVSAENKERFDRGKDVLSLLLGVFGTIVGFYFGSEISSKEVEVVDTIQITRPLLSDEYVVGGQTLTLTAAVSGGVSPYQYGVAFGKDAEVEIFKFVRADGWIVEELNAPQLSSDTILALRLSVRDATGKVASSVANVAITAKAGE